jgi:hypothetical protein
MAGQHYHGPFPDAWIQREIRPRENTTEFPVGKRHRGLFGSWGKAMYAAEIDPNLYFLHHKSRKRR